MNSGLLIKVPVGQYTVAVSGGVDSMVLLDLLARQSNLKLTVAHFDHGIRPDSKLDRLLVQAIARSHKLPFVYTEAKLGEGASEDKARTSRYEFLHKVRLASNSSAIITAHHQDDQLETAIFNLMRGTGRKGLASLQTTNQLIRPLTGYRKGAIYDYALSHNLLWREDPTNQTDKYSRNYVRHQLLPKLSPGGQQRLLELINQTDQLNRAIDLEINSFLAENSSSNGLSRSSFIKLPHAIAKEVMAAWLRHHNVRNFNAKLVDNLTVAAKTFKPGQSADVNAVYFLKVQKDKLALVGRDR